MRNRRRVDIADRLHSIADMVAAGAPLVRVRPFFDSILAGAIKRFERLESDEFAMMLQDLEADLQAHTCSSGDWCYICVVQRRQAGGGV